VRLPRVVARAALIAVLALVVVPGAVGSHIPSSTIAIDPSAYQTVDSGQSWTAATTPQLDNANWSAGHLGTDASLGDPLAATSTEGAARPAVDLPAAQPIVQVIWHYDGNISWYGPGMYGHRTACGYALTTTIIGVANRTLPCGTLVTFRYNGRTVTAPVIDRGPYVSGRTWDMTAGLCAALRHCFTGGGVYYRID
jgi:rare lipoprotein A (peptidoglycan hydrolase)